jgi:hypothetical protein
LQAAHELKVVKQLLQEMSHFLQTPPTGREAYPIGQVEKHSLVFSSVW